MTRVAPLFMALVCAAAHAAPPAAAPATAGSTAPAAPPPEAAEAYRAGVAHFKAARYAEAIAEFNKAYRIAPNAVLVFNMARAFEELREFESAIEFYRRYLQMAPKADDRAAVQDAIRTLELLAKREKEPETGQLTVKSTPDGAAVFVDGRPVGRTPLKTEVPVGAHFVSVEKDGFSRATRELTIEGGKQLDHAATLVPIATATADVDEPSDVAAWLLLGVGGTMVVGGGIIGVLALEQNDQLDKIERGDREATRSEFNDIQDTGRLYAYLADGLLVGGFAAALTGGILLFAGDDSAKTARRTSLLEWTF